MVERCQGYIFCVMCSAQHLDI